MNKFNWFVFIINLLLSCIAGIILILFAVHFFKYPLSSFKDFIEMVSLILSLVGIFLSLVTSLLIIYNQDSEVKQTICNIALLVATIIIAIQLNSLWYDFNRATGLVVIFYIIMIYYLPFFICLFANSLINIIGLCTDENWWLGLFPLIVNVLGGILCYGSSKCNWQINYIIIDVLLFVSGILGIVSFIKAIQDTV